MKMYGLAFCLLFLSGSSFVYCENHKNSLYLLNAIIAGNLPLVKEIIEVKRQIPNYCSLKDLFCKKEGIENLVFYYCYKSCEHSDFFRSLSLEQNFMPIHLAVALGKLEIVKYLMQEKKIDVNVRFYSGPNALYYACANGHIDVLEYLISNGACLFPKNSEWSPLIIASKNGHLDIVNFLLKRRLDVNKKNSELGGKAALHVACEMGKTPVVKALLSSGALVNQESDVWEKYCPIHYACEKLRFGAIKQLMKDREIEIDKKDKWGKTPIILAAESSEIDLAKKIKIVKFFIKNGAVIESGKVIEDKKISSYFESASEFDLFRDKIDEKINFILSNLSDKSLCKVDYGFFVEMALCRSIYELKENYYKFCFGLWEKIKNDDKLRAVFCRALNIDNSYARSGFINSICSKIENSYLGSAEDKDNMCKSVVSCFCKDEFKQNLFKTIKNTEIEPKFTDVTISCLE